MTNELNIDIAAQEEKKKLVSEKFNDNTLDMYLSALSKEELKNICRNLGIKGYSSKSKEDLVSLITEAYFADDQMLDKMLQTYNSDFKVVLDDITAQEKNYMVYHHDIPDEVFLFYADDTELLFIPKDVKAHFNTYKQAHPAFKEEIDKIHFYRSALNLYGFATLKHLAVLKEKYFNVQMTEDEIREELIDVMPEYEALIKDGSVKHKELSNIDIDLKALTEQKDYYIPEYEDYKLYTEHFYVEPTQEIKHLVEYIEAGITEDFQGTDTGKLIVNTILFGLRANETPAQILLHIDNVEQNGFVKFDDREKLTELIAAALNTTRLWTLNGHTRNEVQSKVQIEQGQSQVQPQAPAHTVKKKKPVQVKRKTKKRGKNRNVAHVARLNKQ